MEIVLIRPEGLPQAAGVLARAFLDDPMVRWPLGGPLEDGEEPESLLTTFFIEINRGSVEMEMMWRTGDGRGVVVWLTPEATASFEEDDQVIRPRIAGLTGDGGKRYAVFWDWIASHVPEEPTWFLDQIGVEPSHQGEGIGAALIEHGLAMASTAGQPAFLETGNARNVAYYERFGFEVVSDGDAPDGGPHIWFMRRP